MMDPATITPGIYFGLPEDVYHATPHIGSSGMKELYSSPPDYWWDSAMNPMREAKTDTYAQRFGQALHARILHGEAFFTKHYECVEGETGNEVSAAGLIAWIKARGGVPAKLKDDNFRIVSEQFGVHLMTQEAYERVALAGQMILKNPHLQQAFTGGYPEVSVFWEDNGVPCKARFDYMKARVIVDLKSFRSKERVTTMDKMILQDLFNYRYDIQCGHYINGWIAARELVAAGKVWAAPDTDRPSDDWLAAALKNDPHWAFVFYKADGAPLAKSFQIPYGSPAHAAGRHAVTVASDAYRDNIARFGTDAWVNLDEPFTIAEEDLPRWL